MKDRSHTIISVDAEKVFDKIQHTFKIKNSPQMGYRRHTSQHNKGHTQVHSWHRTRRGKVESFSSNIRNKARMSALTTSIQRSNRAIKQDKEVRGIQTGKDEVEPSLFADDVILHMENPNDSTKKMLDPEWSKQYGERTKLGVSHILISNYTRKL